MVVDVIGSPLIKWDLNIKGEIYSTYKRNVGVLKGAPLLPFGDYRHDVLCMLQAYYKP